jgi:hypothetical protein
MIQSRQSPYHFVLPEIVERLPLDDPFAGVAKQATRYSYAEAILEIGETNPDVVVLDADVSKSIKTWDFGQRFPERWFNFGVAEQNMMAAAAGHNLCSLCQPAGTGPGSEQHPLSAPERQDRCQPWRDHSRPRRRDPPGAGGPVHHALHCQFDCDRPRRPRQLQESHQGHG